MFRSSRFAAVTLIALVITLFSFDAACWASSSLNEPSDHSISQPSSEEQQSGPDNRGPSEGYWWPEIAARDTYAQWASAFFSLLATGISYLAVVYVKDTLIETRKAVGAANDAVVTTRDIGRAQSRAYLYVSSCSFNVVNGIVDRSQVTLTLTNSGNSPATQVRYFAKATLKNIDAIDMFTPVDSIDYSEHISAIPANSFKVVKAIPFGIEPMWRSYADKISLYDAVFSSDVSPVFSVDGVVFYKDIFGVKFSSSFSFFLEPVGSTDANFAAEFVTTQADIPVFTEIENGSA